MLYLKLCFLRLCCPSVSWHGQLQIQKFQDVHWVSHSWGYYIWLCATNTFLSSCLLRSEVMTEFLLKNRSLLLANRRVCSWQAHLSVPEWRAELRVEWGQWVSQMRPSQLDLSPLQEQPSGEPSSRRLWETCQIVHIWLKTVDSQGRIPPPQSSWRWFCKSSASSFLPLGVFRMKMNSCKGPITACCLYAHSVMLKWRYLRKDTVLANSSCGFLCRLAPG